MRERFVLIEIEKEETEIFPDYDSLDFDRDVEFRVYENRVDQYGNKSRSLLITTPNILYAKQFVRSCRLTDGIVIEES